MLNDTTRMDLENLMSEVDNGWDNGSNPNHVSLGVGGCLLQAMNRVLGEQHPAMYARKEAMVLALGFKRSPHPPIVYFGGMYLWNDSQTHPDAIKLRIKDALNSGGPPR